MSIEILDPKEIERAVFDECAELSNAVSAVDSPQNAPVSGFHLQGLAKYSWDNRGVDKLILARGQDGALTGCAWIELGHWDNTSTAFVEFGLHPDQRLDVLGERVLEATYDVMRAHDRNLIIANTWRDSPLTKFLASRGFDVAQHSAQRRLWMSRLDWTRLDELHAMSLEKSTGYDIVELPHPAPQDMLAGMLELHRAINDAPMDDLAIEDEQWTPERIRGYEQAMTNRDIRLLRLIAVRRSDGEYGGQTVLAIEDERPTLGFQEDTAVVASHRGHRLGFRLKIEMLQVLRDREPQVETVDTWNAESNSHMLAVNDALGCVVAGQGDEVQRTID